jgi:hypothetical protein
MLTGDKKLLELTRILPNSELDEESDFYLYMLAFLEKEIPILKKLKRFTGDKLITRDYLKDILIPFMYNEGIRGTFKTLDGIEQLRDQVTTHIKDKKDPVFYLAYHIRKNLDLCFPNVPKIKGFLNKIIDCNFDNRSLNLMDQKANGYITSKMYYAEVIEQNIRVGSWKDQTWAKIQAIKQPRTLDKDKCKVAAAPNLIHSLDAFLMLETVRILKEKQIPVSTLHDCFLVLKRHRQETQLAYQEAVKVLMKQDFLVTIKDNPNNMVQNINATEPLTIDHYPLVVGNDLASCKDDPLVMGRCSRLASNDKGSVKDKTQKKKLIKKMDLLETIIQETKTSREQILNEEFFNNEPLKEDEAVFVIKDIKT